MKKLLTLSAIGLVFALGACSTTPETKTTSTAEAASMKAGAETEMKAGTEDEMKKAKKKDKKKDKKKGLSRVFDASADDAKQATLTAMQKNGFLLKDTSGYVLEGKRSNKIGLMVGSGGEKMMANIVPMDDGKTEVTVRTKKTFVGIAGQKNWDDEVMDMIEKALSE